MRNIGGVSMRPNYIFWVASTWEVIYLGGFVIGSDNMIFWGSFTFAAAFGWPFARYDAWPFAWHAAAFLLSICFCYPHLDIGIGPNSALA